MESTHAAIVTAAGASSRMGDDHKALLGWLGRPLVAHQVEVLAAAGFDPIVVVTGADGEAVGGATPEAATVVDNPDWREGRSRSIALGAETLPDDVEAVLVVAVDQPLDRAVLDQIVDDAGAPLVQPVDADGRPGHPVILGGEQLPALRRIEEEPEGLRTIVRRLRPAGTMVEVDDLPHWDLNTPEAYRRARQQAARRTSNSH